MNDKDNAANLVTGILIAGEIQRRNDEAVREQEHKNRQLNKQNELLEKEKSSAEAKNRNLRVFNDDLAYDAEVLELRNVQLETKLQSLEGAYEKQMDLLAEWMVSQKAFKELALELGQQQGLSKEEVIERGSKKRLDVLENKHDESHNTNIEGSAVVTPERARRLKEKIQAQ